MGFTSVYGERSEAACSPHGKRIVSPFTTWTRRVSLTRLSVPVHVDGCIGLTKRKFSTVPGGDGHRYVKGWHLCAHSKTAPVLNNTIPPRGTFDCGVSAGVYTVAQSFS